MLRTKNMPHSSTHSCSVRCTYPPTRRITLLLVVGFVNIFGCGATVSLFVALTLENCRSNPLAGTLLCCPLLHILPPKAAASNYFYNQREPTFSPRS